MLKKIVNLFVPKTVEVLIYSIIESKRNYDILDKYEITRKKESWRKTDYEVLDGNVKVHKSAIYRFSPTLFYLGLKGALIGNCYTNPDYRGQSIYPKVLSYIVLKESVKQKEKNNRFFIFVSPKNQASIAGVEKVGFEKTVHFKAKRWLCFFYNKEVIKF